MNRLLTIKSKEDILSEYRQTPIGKLIEYHNLNQIFGKLQWRCCFFGNFVFWKCKDFSYKNI